MQQEEANTATSVDTSLDLHLPYSSIIVLLPLAIALLYCTPVGRLYKYKHQQLAEIEQSKAKQTKPNLAPLVQYHSCPYVSTTFRVFQILC
jgi:hypothetical protein